MRDLIQNIAYLKTSLIEHLTNPNVEGEMNKPYIYIGGKSYSKAELVQEFETNSDLSNELLSDIVILAIDIVSRKMNVDKSS